MTHLVRIRHNAEAAHRLPALGGKCVNLHGHSWQLEVAVAQAELRDGIAVEFAALKSGLRTWVDTNIDHATLLGADDPLEPVLREHGCRVFTFGSVHPLTHDLAWPTVENMAVLLGRVAQGLIKHLVRDPGDLRYPYVAGTVVQETAVNTAEWVPS